MIKKKFKYRVGARIMHVVTVSQPSIVVNYYQNLESYIKHYKRK